MSDGLVDALEEEQAENYDGGNDDKGPQGP